MALFLLSFLGFPPAEACSLAADRAVVVNEIFSDPPGADAGQEWVELALGAEDDPADLQGWAILAGTRSLTSGPGFPPTRLEPGEHRVVTSDDGLPTLGNAGSGSADVVQLVDCEGNVADTVVYGGPNSDGFVDDLGTIASSLAPAPPTGSSIGRTPDGVDTDLAAEDFVIFDVPSPGAPNPRPTTCAPNDGVVINELVVNPAGADAPFEMVELFGSGGQPVELAGWALVAATRSDRQTVIELPDEATLAAGGFLVIGGPGVPEASVVRELGLGNGDGTDGVRLLDCAGSTVDTVVYGDPGNEDGIADDQGFVDEPYGAPGEDESLARRADGIDTDGPGDWAIRPTATPGATNAVDLGELTAPTGCQRPPEVRPAPQPREPTGCGTAPGGALWAFGVLAVLSRRPTSRPSADRGRGPCARPSR